MMRVVSPYRPFTPESQSHKLLGEFDWIEALKMLAVSVTRSCQCETLAITDQDTALPVPALAFQTAHRRLMLWILEVSLRYLESDAFDRDTVLVSPDTLIYGDISRLAAGADLGILVRPQAKFEKRPILNSVQWWSVDAKDRLIGFYREALAIAATLDKHTIRWGADTVPLHRLLAPLTVGRVERHGLTAQMVSAEGVFESISSLTMAKLDARVQISWPPVPIVDFRYLRKKHMAAMFRATIGAEVQA